MFSFSPPLPRLKPNLTWILEVKRSEMNQKNNESKEIREALEVRVNRVRPRGFLTSAVSLAENIHFLGPRPESICNGIYSYEEFPQLDLQ